MSREDSASTRVPMRRGAIAMLTAAVALGAAVGVQPAAAQESAAADSRRSASATSVSDALAPFLVRSLDGRNNNLANPSWGQAGTNYTRVGAANYADKKNTQVGGPGPRFTSNRVFNDIGQNVFSERRVTQWGWAWGQFLDHTFGLRRDGRRRAARSRSTRTIRSRRSRNDLGVSRSPATAAPTGPAPVPRTHASRSTRSQLTSTRRRLRRRQRAAGLAARGSRDGDPANNRPRCCCRATTCRGATRAANAATAPDDGRRRPAAGPPAATAASPVTCGPTRTSALTAHAHAVRARAQPDRRRCCRASLSEEDKFQIARRVVVAEQQYITYNEFLPAMGVGLPRVHRLQPERQRRRSRNEFATVGYRAHSQIHGEFEIETNAAGTTPATLDRLRARASRSSVDGDEVESASRSNVAFFNPDLLERSARARCWQALRRVAVQERRADRQPAAQRAVPDPAPAGDPRRASTARPPDVLQRRASTWARSTSSAAATTASRTYNQLRAGVRPAARRRRSPRSPARRPSVPVDPRSRGNEINNPNILDFIALLRHRRQPRRPLGAERRRGTAASGARTIAARLKAHLRQRQQRRRVHRHGRRAARARHRVRRAAAGDLDASSSSALRDGDRFFYGNDQGLSTSATRTASTSARTLAELIARNTDVIALTSRRTCSSPRSTPVRRWRATACRPPPAARLELRILGSDKATRLRRGLSCCDSHSSSRPSYSGC